MAQSRTQVITPQSDNMGFAKWVDSTKSYWASISRPLPITVFGEWCGAGIMKGTAISQIGKKVFAVFAIAVEEVNGQQTLITHPDALSDILNTPCENVHVLPWYGEEVTIDFSKPSQLLEVVEKLNKVVEEIEPSDPWVKSVFGVEGTAEGVVYYPKAGLAQVMKEYGDFAFKAKGDKHKTVKSKEAVQIAPEVAANVDAFVNMFVTEARCEQGLAAIGVPLEMKNVGNFLKWIAKDVKKESIAELEASNLSWEDVQRQVQGAGKTWFINKCKAV